MSKRASCLRVLERPGARRSLAAFSQVRPATRTVSPVGQLKGRVRPARLHLRQFRAMRIWRFNCITMKLFCRDDTYTQGTL
jgi:hypothetical protein